MKHFCRTTLPVVGMEHLLQQRKAGLEAQVADRFRQARASGTVANVKLLSATLRAVKRQIGAVGDG